MTNAPMLCAVCRRPFKPKRKTQVTCSTACSGNRYTPVPKVVKECAWCRRPFEGFPSRVYCSAACSDAFFKAEYEERRRRSEGKLVYLWFDEGAQLPYYVGSGYSGREAEPHPGLRDPARVVVVKRRLTPGWALFYESCLISAMRACGAPLVNERDPLTRSPAGPMCVDELAGETIAAT